jgi:Ribbon-helix-helix protein, copG family
MPRVYTHPMAKVMISIPDALLGTLDAEVKRRQTTRSALLQEAARRELGLVSRPRESVLADLDALSGDWDGPVDAVALIRADRRRDG